MKVFRSYRLAFVLVFLILIVMQPLLYRSFAVSPDEGYFMFMGSSITDGATPYVDFADNKPPGIWYLLSAAFFIFGKSVFAARAITYAANAVTALVLYLIGKRLWNEKAGIICSLLYLIGVLIPAFEGYFTLTEQYVALFSSLGIWLYIKGEQRTPYLIAAGAAMGVATLFKQTGILVLIAGVGFYLLNLWIPANRNRRYLGIAAKNTATLLGGFAVPVLIVVLYFWSVNALGSLIQYTIFGLREYGTYFSIAALRYEFLSFSIIWITVAGAMAVIIYRFARKDSGWDTLLGIWLVFSFLPLISRQYGHYFIQILPPACLLASRAVEGAIRRSSQIKEALRRLDVKYLAATAFAVLLLIISAGVSTYGYVQHSTSGESLQSQIQTSQYVRSNTTREDKILVYPYQPSIYFLSDRDPCVEVLFFSPSVMDAKTEFDLSRRIIEYGPKYVVIPTDDENDVSTGRTLIYQFVAGQYHKENTIGNFIIYGNNGKPER